MKLLITGGHVTPALAVIDELERTNKKTQIIYVGRKFTSENSKEETFEYLEIKRRKIPFVHLKAGRLTRVISLQTLTHLVKVPIGIYQAFRILRKYKPDRILSFGGYIALPIAIVGSFLHIPVYTHEQTIHPGIANKMISRVARKVFISFQDSKKYFPRRKILLTGNPIRKQALEIKEKPFHLQTKEPVIYITGGSLGSHSINVLIEQILIKLLKRCIVIHQTGNVKEYNDFRRLCELKELLPDELKQRYFLYEHFTTDEVGYVYSVSDLLVGRSGANTFFELVVLEKPAVFIPLPWSSHNEQKKQALLFKKWGVGQVFDQSHKSEGLYVMIMTALDDLKLYRQHFIHANLEYAKNAAQTIIKTVVG